MQRAYLPTSELNKEKWISDNKEKELRYNYELDNTSVVLDVGGYEGDFAAEIFARYQCKIYVFEPVTKYVDYLKTRFAKNNHIHIIPQGLSNKNAVLSINVMDEASSYNRTASIHKKGIEEKISLTDVSKFFADNNLSRVNLLKINIEGAEYDLLDKMITENLVQRCTNLQVQFHDFYPDFQNRYRKIKEALEKTHKLTYSYPFVWENWQLK